MLYFVILLTARSQGLYPEAANAFLPIRGKVGYFSGVSAEPEMICRRNWAIFPGLAESMLPAGDQLLNRHYVVFSHRRQFIKSLTYVVSFFPLCFLWHMNRCWIFKAKSYIYIYIYIYIFLIFLFFFYQKWYTCFFYIIFVNPFELPYSSDDIRRESVDRYSIISYFPSTFCPTLGHRQGWMY